MFRASILALLVALPAWADPYLGSTTYGLSASSNAPSRNTFANPAALGFQTSLNGFGVDTSAVYAARPERPDDFGFGLDLGYFGVAADRVHEAYSRYQFAAGLPFGDLVYLGGRFRLMRGRSAGFSDFDAWDFGLQIRPLSWWSFGLVAQQINEPQTATGRQRAEIWAGTTLRVINGLDLMADAWSTSGSGFLKQVGYQFGASWQARPGLKLQAFYNSQFKALFGLQLNLGSVSITPLVQTGARTSLVGIVEGHSTPTPKSFSPPIAAQITLDGRLSEEGVRPSLFMEGRPSHLKMLERVDELCRRDSVEAVVVEIDSFPLGFAAAQEWHAALEKLRQSGKRVMVYLGNAGVKEYLIASAANQIRLAPGAELRLLGPRSERYYLKGTLDKIGIEGEFVAKGEYKSAPEMFTREHSSQLSRDTTLEELRQTQDVLYTLVSRHRSIDKAKWKKWFDTALFGAAEAKAAGLVDDTGDFRQDKKTWSKRYWVRELWPEQSEALALPSRVAVIVVDGNILGEKVRLLSLAGASQATPEVLEKKFERALSDPRTQAIVLRVNSPGGEILASHQIAALVEKTRAQVPVIVSMGDVAASGGYLISAPASRIFANPLTATGSIGVFLGKFSAAGLFKWLKLNKEILSPAPHASLYSEDRPWTDEDKRIAVRRLDQFYSDFVAFVADRRHISAVEAEKAAKGRVWLGKEALDHKLVDEMGGFMETLRYAEKQAGLRTAESEMWIVREPGALFEMADWIMGAKTQASALLPSPWLRTYEQWQWMQEHPHLYWSPVSLSD